MAFRCVIVDDERPARERLKRLLAAHHDFEIVGEAADAAAAVELLDTTRPDLCFLDVRMPEGDGFRVLERANHVPGVIFTTAFDEYAVRAFEVHSLDYLLKPFSRRRFVEALDRARSSLAGNKGSDPRVVHLLERLRQDLTGGAATKSSGLDRISARRGTKIVLLAPSEVLFFEAEETLVFARTAEGRFLVERTLADLAESLSPGFFRAHRRYLVQLARIAEIVPGDAGTYGIVLRDADCGRVPLSRRQARKLKEIFQW